MTDAPTRPATLAVDEKLDRLPKWAQDEIRRLRMNLADAEREITLLKGGEPSRIVVDDLLRGEHRPLGDHAVITFDLGNNTSISASIRSDEPSRVNLSCSGGIADGIDVWPRANNVISVGVRLYK